MRPGAPSVLSLGFLVLLGACATTSTPDPVAHSSVGSGYSSGVSESPREASGVPMAEGASGLVIRPDLLALDLRIEEDDANAGQALARAQLAAADVVARLQQATGGAATLTPCGTQVTPVGTQVTPVGGRGKAAPEPADTFNVKVEGRIEIPLASELDYWKRSALVGALAELIAGTDRARAAKTPGKRIWLGRMRVAVKDPESHRAKLTEQWVQRARAFATAAQSRDAPLYVLDCAPPGEIQQRQQSLEEVVLSLQVSCRIASPKAPAGPAPR